MHAEISKRVLEESEGIEWEEGGEIEWGFNRRDGRLIIKGMGPLEDYVYGVKTCQVKDFGDWRTNRLGERNTRGIQSLLSFAMECLQSMACILGV